MKAQTAKLRIGFCQAQLNLVGLSLALFSVDPTGYRLYEIEQSLKIDKLIGRQYLLKMTKMEDELNGRQYQLKMTSFEDDLN